MTVSQAAILGVIQGITEFLPISSSGHLIFVPVFFGWRDQGLAFDVVVHLGTLVAVVYYFRKRLFGLRKGVFAAIFNRKKEDMRYLILLSMVPALFVGFLFEVFDLEIRSSAIVGINLIFWGMVLVFADYAGRENQKQIDSMTKKQAWQIGLAQAIALIPGTSRSGITMTAGLLSGFTRKDAAEFSFLMSIPIISIAGGIKVAQLLFSQGAGIEFNVLVMGFLASAISGLFAIWVLMKIVEKWSFVPFGIYRIIVGLFIFVYLV